MVPIGSKLVAVGNGPERVRHEGFGMQEEFQAKQAVTGESKGMMPVPRSIGQDK